MRIEQHLPADLHIPHLAELVARQGSWLLAEQPRRTLPDLDQMKAVFERTVARVCNGLQCELAAAWPAIPFVGTRYDMTPQQTEMHAVYWLCDPIDGAVQYLSGLPLWNISLCLMVQGEAVLAIVHEPATGRSYDAWRGRGARCNGIALAASARNTLSLSIAGTSFPNFPPRPMAEVSAFTAQLQRVIPQVLAQRWMGPASISLAQVGAGLLDAYWELGGNLDDWRAGALVAREAGAIVSAIDGTSLRPGCGGILASGKALHGEWVALLEGAQALRV